MTHRDSINIALCCDSNYCYFAAATILSIVRNTDASLCFHIIGDSLTEDNLAVLRKNTLLRENIDIVFYSCGEPLKDCYTSNHISRATYLRLLIGSILPEDIKKVIYFDCDMLVLKDVAELWAVSLNDHIIAACSDTGIVFSRRDRENKEKLLALRPFRYFNAGLLIIDLEKWRKADIESRLAPFLEGQKFKHHDQDILNILFEGDWHQIPTKWNITPPVYLLSPKIVFHKDARKEAVDALNHAANIHFSGTYKPWLLPAVKGVTDLYYGYLREVLGSNTLDVNAKNRAAVLRQVIKFKLARAIFPLLKRFGSKE